MQEKMSNCAHIWKRFSQCFIYLFSPIIFMNTGNANILHPDNLSLEIFCFPFSQLFHIHAHCSCLQWIMLQLQWQKGLMTETASRNISPSPIEPEDTSYLTLPSTVSIFWIDTIFGTCFKLQYGELFVLVSRIAVFINFSLIHSQIHTINQNEA